MKIYLVGGAVRDQLLQLIPQERDWVVVGATPEEMIAQGFQPVGKDFPVFLHPQSKEEYALARTERKNGRGHTGFDCYADPSVTLEEDLLRRDLTINAMAQDSHGDIIDPYHGRDDIDLKVLRHVSPAFVEDPLRVLRVARFAARLAHLGFTIASETMALMREIVASNELTTLPAERIWKELERALGEPSPQQFFAALAACGALAQLLPNLDLHNHQLTAALHRSASAQQPVTIRFALLFAHTEPTLTEQYCRALKAPNEFRELALLLSRQSPSLSRSIPDAQSLLTLLESADAFRRPGRLEQLLQCAALVYPDSPAANQLRSALLACQTLDPKALAQSGLQGKAIGEALRRQRLKLIEQQCINAP